MARMNPQLLILQTEKWYFLYLHLVFSPRLTNWIIFPIDIMLNNDGDFSHLSKRSYKWWGTYMSYREGYFHFVSNREKFQWYC